MKEKKKNLLSQKAPTFTYINTLKGNGRERRKVIHTYVAASPNQYYIVSHCEYVNPQKATKQTFAKKICVTKSVAFKFYYSFLLFTYKIYALLSVYA